MATEKTPIRTVFADDGSAEGLAEFQSGEVVGYEHGGTGLDTLGSANQVLQVSANGSAIVWGNKTQVDLDPYLQVANATSTFQTKVDALAANSSLLSLIEDRIQVANAVATFQTKADSISSNNALVSLIEDRIQVANAVATFQTKADSISSNNALVSLIEDRIQVANAQSLFVNVSGDTMSGELAMGTNKITGLGAPTADTDASTKKYVDDEVAGLVNSAPEALDTLNELAAALGDDANFATTVTNSLSTKAANTYVNSTFQTIAVSQAYLANTNQAIATKISTTDARAEFLQSGNTSVTADATSITVAQRDVDLEDRALVNPAGFLTINIGGVNYKLPYFS